MKRKIRSAGLSVSSDGASSEGITNARMGSGAESGAAIAACRRRRLLAMFAGICAGVFAGSGGVASAQVQDATWLYSSGGQWSDGSQWSTGVVPGVTPGVRYRAFLPSLDRPYDVALSTDVSLDSLSIGSGVWLRASNTLISVRDGLSNAGFLSLTNATVAGVPGAGTVLSGLSPFQYSSSPTLRDLTITADLTVPAQGVAFAATLRDVVLLSNMRPGTDGQSITLAGRVTGTGVISLAPGTLPAGLLRTGADATTIDGPTIRFSGPSGQAGRFGLNGPLSIGAGTRIEGGAGSMSGPGALTLGGQLVMATAGATMGIGPTSLSNTGSIAVSAGTLSIGWSESNGWSNTGSISLSGGVLSIAPSSTGLWALGNVLQTGGTLRLGGRYDISTLSTLVRTGGSLELGGTIVNSGGGELRFGGATLPNVTLANPTVVGTSVSIDPSVPAFSQLGLTDATLINQPTNLRLSLSGTVGLPTVRFTGSGARSDSIQLADSTVISSGQLIADSPAGIRTVTHSSLTIGSGVEVHGPWTGQSLLGFGNDGLLENSSGSPMRFDAAILRSSGSIAASNGSSITLSGSNNGPSWPLSGSIRVQGAGSSVSIGSKPQLVGPLETVVSGGTLRFSDGLTGSGQVVDLGSASGRLVLGGWFSGFTLRLPADPTQLSVELDSGLGSVPLTLREMTLSGAWRPTPRGTPNKIATIERGLTNNGAIILGGGSRLEFSPVAGDPAGVTYGLEGTGRLVFDPSGPSAPIVGPDGESTVRWTSGPGRNGEGHTIVNRGAIAVSISSGPSLFTNAGTIRVENGDSGRGSATTLSAGRVVSSGAIIATGQSTLRITGYNTPVGGGLTSPTLTSSGRITLGGASSLITDGIALLPGGLLALDLTGAGAGPGSAVVSIFGGSGISLGGDLWITLSSDQVQSYALGAVAARIGLGLPLGSGPTTGEVIGAFASVTLPTSAYGRWLELRDVFDGGGGGGGSPGRRTAVEVVVVPGPSAAALGVLAIGAAHRRRRVGLRNRALGDSLGSSYSGVAGGECGR